MIPVEPGDGDPRVLRQAFGSFPSGVIAVCALHQGAPAGMAVSSFTSVSLAPPLVSVCVQNTSATWPKLRERRRLGVSVLAEDQDRACRALSSKDGDRFANVDWYAGDDDAVFVRGAAAWFGCSVEDELPAGDHVIVLLRIHALATEPDVAPLVFHGSRFRRLDDRGDLVVSP
ncbi:flavin reductase (DIM6/NTAB) family NADH-FMN oxidoreductase RutF [Amycolatopsis bartoniae]|uniref:Oxidoreductase n=1 Tax=Amycolatopsis bartoniae TaxID=941986 RepID=A0A8H9ISG2_9PSEU|nr:flavin reductase family protein [Amycolatopsis bartoniae]MBB2939885.1 flavin reductase (DIM6/NTAB) family NADH-FMN oxidoreductase RutF [Amycolatopsis bartoniae]TVT08327.1 flavin reductase family protein [Amycolatopsis bartoniae]GHF35884.1 oxidoreductase [Amycolatopsis bartoniae]